MRRSSKDAVLKLPKYQKIKSSKISATGGRRRLHTTTSRAWWTYRGSPKPPIHWCSMPREQRSVLRAPRGSASCSRPYPTAPETASHRPIHQNGTDLDQMLVIILHPLNLKNHFFWVHLVPDNSQWLAEMNRWDGRHRNGTYSRYSSIHGRTHPPSIPGLSLHWLKPITRQKNPSKLNQHV